MIFNLDKLDDCLILCRLTKMGDSYVVRLHGEFIYPFSDSCHLLIKNAFLDTFVSQEELKEIFEVSVENDHDYCYFYLSSVYLINMINGNPTSRGLINHDPVKKYRDFVLDLASELRTIEPKNSEMIKKIYEFVKKQNSETPLS